VFITAETVFGSSPPSPFNFFMTYPKTKQDQEGESLLLIDATQTRRGSGASTIPD